MIDLSPYAVVGYLGLLLGVVSVLIALRQGVSYDPRGSRGRSRPHKKVAREHQQAERERMVA